jgi:hypothetical protein
MQPSKRNSFSTATALVLIALMATGCTRVVEIPLAQLEGTAPDHKGKYRISTIDGSSYIARGFALSDSTIVIKKLDQDDERYRTAKLPVTLALRDVKTFEKLEFPGIIIDLLVVAGLVAVAIFFIYLSYGTSDDTFVPES